MMTRRSIAWRSSLLGLVVLGLGTLSGCSSDVASTTAGKARTGPPRVAATIEVNRWLASEIAGDAIEVFCPVDADADPLHWKPGRDAVSALQDADLVILNGVGLETWRDKVSLSTSKTVTLGDAYKDRWLFFEEEVVHQHGPDGDHTHTGSDPHVWFDFLIVTKHGEQILSALESRWPEHKASFQENWQGLKARIDEIEAAWKAIDGSKMPELLANHPAYDYGARRYGLKIENHDLDPESVPDEKTLAEVTRSGRKILLWESAPTEEVRAAYAARGLQSVVIAAGEQPPESGDWGSLMLENARRVAELAQ